MMVLGVTMLPAQRFLHYSLAKAPFCVMIGGPNGKIAR